MIRIWKSLPAWLQVLVIAGTVFVTVTVLPKSDLVRPEALSVLQQETLQAQKMVEAEDDYDDDLIVPTK